MVELKIFRLFLMVFACGLVSNASRSIPKRNGVIIELEGQADFPNVNENTRLSPNFHISSTNTHAEILDPLTDLNGDDHEEDLNFQQKKNIPIFSLKKYSKNWENISDSEDGYISSSSDQDSPANSPPNPDYKDGSETDGSGDYSEDFAPLFDFDEELLNATVEDIFNSTQEEFSEGGHNSSQPQDDIIKAWLSDKEKRRGEKGTELTPEEGKKDEGRTEDRFEYGRDDDEDTEEGVESYEVEKDRPDEDDTKGDEKEEEKKLIEEETSRNYSEEEKSMGSKENIGASKEENPGGNVNSEKLEKNVGSESEDENVSESGKPGGHFGQKAINSEEESSSKLEKKSEGHPTSEDDDEEEFEKAFEKYLGGNTSDDENFHGKHQNLHSEDKHENLEGRRATNQNFSKQNIDEFAENSESHSNKGTNVTVSEKHKDGRVVKSPKNESSQENKDATLDEDVDLVKSERTPHSNSNSLPNSEELSANHPEEIVGSNASSNSSFDDAYDSKPDRNFVILNNSSKLNYKNYSKLNSSGDREGHLSSSLHDKHFDLGENDSFSEENTDSSSSGELTTAKPDNEAISSLDGTLVLSGRKDSKKTIGDHKLREEKKVNEGRKSREEIDGGESNSFYETIRRNEEDTDSSKNSSQIETNLEHKERVILVKKKNEEKRQEDENADHIKDNEDYVPSEDGIFISNEEDQEETTNNHKEENESNHKVKGIRIEELQNSSEKTNTNSTNREEKARTSNLEKNYENLTNHSSKGHAVSPKSPRKEFQVNHETRMALSQEEEGFLPGGTLFSGKITPGNVEIKGYLNFTFKVLVDGSCVHFPDEIHVEEQSGEKMSFKWVQNNPRLVSVTFDLLCENATSCYLEGVHLALKNNMLAAENTSPFEKPLDVSLSGLSLFKTEVGTMYQQNSEVTVLMKPGVLITLSDIKFTISENILNAFYREACFLRNHYPECIGGSLGIILIAGITYYLCRKRRDREMYKPSLA